MTVLFSDALIANKSLQRKAITADEHYASWLNERKVIE